MRLIALGPRLLGIRWGLLLNRKDLEKVFGGRTAAGAFNPDTESFIYVVKGEHGRVKIGITSNPNARLLQLQTGSAYPIEFAWIGAPQGQAVGIEYDAHQMLVNYRRNGEWFEVMPDAAVGAICAAAQRRGMNILSCTPELAEKIRQVGSQQSTKPSRTHRFMTKAAITVWIAVAVVVVLGLTAQFFGH